MKKKEESNKGTAFSLFIIFVILVGGVLFSPRGQSEQKPAKLISTANAPQLTQPHPPPHYLDEEMHKFWDNHLNNIVMVELVGGKHPIPAINALYHTRDMAIRQRYGRPYRIEVSTGYGPDSVYAPSAAKLENGTPILQIYVPTMMYIYHELLPGGADLEKDFESMVTISIFHELDHMSLGQIGYHGQTRDEVITAETATWAVTSENAISALINLGLPVDAGDLSYYREWISCGRQRNACWTSFIYQTYAYAGALPK